MRPQKNLMTPTLRWTKLVIPRECTVPPRTRTSWNRYSTNIKLLERISMAAHLESISLQKKKRIKQVWTSSWSGTTCQNRMLISIWATNLTRLGRSLTLTNKDSLILQRLISSRGSSWEPSPALWMVWIHLNFHRVVVAPLPQLLQTLFLTASKFEPTLSKSLVSCVFLRH